MEDHAVACAQTGNALIINGPARIGRLKSESLDDEGSPRARILIVGGDWQSRQEVTNYLQGCAMSVSSAGGLEEAARQLMLGRLDLVLLDTPFGPYYGLKLLQNIESSMKVPVIVTGSGSDEDEVVTALELGAVDYLRKPFGLRELSTRIRVVLRRCKRHDDTARTMLKRRVRCRFGGWEFNRPDRCLTAPDGSRVTLTRCEYALLVALLDAQGRLLKREFLILATGGNKDIFDRSVDTQVFRLRRKLETLPSALGAIQTERGVGYAFRLKIEMLEV